MDKKLLAKYAALKKTSDSLKEDARKPIGEELAKKKMNKVTVMAPDEKSLEKGLTKAQELLKAKFGEMGLEEDEMEEMDEESCPMCSGEGCEECEHEMEEEDEIEE